MKSRLVLPGTYATEETAKVLDQNYKSLSEQLIYAEKEICKMNKENNERIESVRRWCRREIGLLYSYLKWLTIAALVLGFALGVVAFLLIC